MTKKFNLFKDYTNQYKVTKTLRFALKPTGETVKHLEEKGLLQEDKQRADDYKKAKLIIDEYHKWFIEKRLGGFEFSLEDLENFKEAYEGVLNNETDAKAKKDLKESQKTLRKKVADHFGKDSHKPKFDVLIQWLVEEDSKKIIKGFDRWKTYFKGFEKNRENVYTDKEHSTAIGYRLIHENLPEFLRNLGNLKTAKDAVDQFLKNPKNSKEELVFDVDGLDGVFTLESFNKCLTQTGIDKYNEILGGKTLEDDMKKIGINQVINLYGRQLVSQKKELKGDDRKAKEIKGPKMKPLFKQILSDRDSSSFRWEEVQNDGALCDLLEDFLPDNITYQDDNNEKPKVIDDVKTVLESLKEADLDKVYLKNDRVDRISKDIFKSYYIIKHALEFYVENENLGIDDNKGKPKKLTKTQREKWLKKSYFSFREIIKALDLYFGQDEKDISDDLQRFIDKDKKDLLCDYFIKLITNIDHNKVKLIENIRDQEENFSNVLKNYKGKNGQQLKNKKGEDGDVDKIKKYLDALKHLQWFLKPLYVTLRKKSDKAQVESFQEDNTFYTDFNKLYKSLEGVISVYDQTRNYLTKKPYSTEKYKLNFGKNNLMGGFVESDGNTQYGAYLFRKKNQIDEYDYFLGVSSKATWLQYKSQDKILSMDRSEYERLNYYQPKNTTFFGDDYTESKIEITEFLNKEIDKLNTDDYKDDKKNMINLIKKIKQKENFRSILDQKYLIRACNKVIADLKEHSKKYLDKNPELGEFIEGKYSGVDGMLKMVEDLQNYAKGKKDYKYFKVSEPELQDALNHNEKPLYLFKISNKDLDFNDKFQEGKRKSRGRDNLHTMYFKALMQDPKFLNNEKQNVIDIGTGELFYREKTEIKKNTTHRKDSPIVCKTYRDGEDLKTVPLNDYIELTDFYLGEDEDSENKLSESAKDIKEKVQTRTFNYDIVKDKRYTEPRYSFHLSLFLNFSKPKTTKNINNKVRQTLKDNSKEEVHIIGIDRGERHLAYYTVINPKGEIVEQASLNDPQGKGTKDYRELLDKREQERGEARKSWGTIEKIKDLKEGYLSQVVHKIVQLMLKYNAIVVFEDLNFRFKRGRFKVEKQVYQKLEKMLIDKLNYLVIKDKEDITEQAGVLNALQLTAPFESFQKMGKQTGFVFYVPAYHTSKICPATGFVNLLYPKYETIKKAQGFFKAFDKICFNGTDFEFSFDYQNFKTKKQPGKAEGSKQKWTIHTHGKRLGDVKNGHGKWETKKVDLNEEFKELFKKYDITTDAGCFKEQIVKQDKCGFFKELIHLLKLTLQMRNSRIGSKEDYLISPVKDDNGNFFDSRKVGDEMPKDADANGAYHIAMKGLQVLKQLEETTDDVSKFKPDTTNKSWYKFIQDKKNGK